MTTTRSKRTRTWNAVLWIMQIVLAAMFLMVGAMKTFVPIDELSKTLPMAGELPLLTRFIGIVELLGSAGLLLPAMLRVAPRLTVLAAYAFAVLMLLAFLFHLQKEEYAALGTNAVLGGIAFAVAWGRTHKAPILPRTKTVRAVN